MSALAPIPPPLSEFTLTQLRYFVAAAAAGSMTAAAAELYVAQSAVSAAVAAVERSLGVQLFIRQHARGLVLTAAGQGLYVQAKALLAQAAELKESARSIANNAAGEVNFGCFTTISPFVVPRVLAQCDRFYPQVRVRVRELETRPAFYALLDGTCDLALLYDLGIGEQFECIRVGATAPHVILPPNHPLAGEPGVRLADLVDEPMILLDIPRSTEYFEELLRNAGIAPTVRYRSSSYETVRGLVAEGQGYSVLNQRPAFSTTYVGQSVVTLPVLDEVEPLALALVTLAGTRKTSSARALAAVCQSVIPAAVGPPHF